MKNLLIRTLSGLIYILLILSGICLGTWSYVTVFGLLLVLCLYEFYQLMNANEPVTVRPLINCVAGLYFFIATFLYLSSGQANGILYLPYILYVLGILVMELYLKRPNPIQNWAYAFLGQIYIVLPFATLHALCLSFDPATSVTAYSPVLLLALFSFIWINDTFAYLVGITFGKHRLFERISPKKSWEGFVGGAVFSIASSLVFACYVPEIPKIHWICMSVVTVIFATWGDLIESLLKRTLGVKDSGKMIPGHGGILDRMDSTLLAAPALACCYYLLGEM
jgi:phosphatidate cytidylyltransferase